MTNLIDMEQFKKQCINRYRFCLFGSVILLLLILGGDFLLIYFSNEYFIANMIIAILITCLGLWAFVFYLTNLFTPATYLHDVCKKYSEFNVNEGTFEVVENKEITKSKIEFKAIKVSYLDGGNSYTRDLLLIKDVDLAPKTKIRAMVYQSFLIGYEVITDENN